MTGLIFQKQLGVESSSQLTTPHIFQRGRYTTNHQYIRHPLPPPGPRSDRREDGPAPGRGHRYFKTAPRSAVHRAVIVFMTHRSLVNYSNVYSLTHPSLIETCKEH